MVYIILYPSCHGLPRQVNKIGKYKIVKFAEGTDEPMCCWVSIHWQKWQTYLAVKAELQL